MEVKHQMEIQMKLSKITLYSSLAFSVLTSSAFAHQPVMKDTMPIVVPGKFYVGVFGGGGATDNINASQYGTAFFTAAAGGPLAVNGFGRVNSNSTWLAGAQVGYQVPAIPLCAEYQWSFAPAFELEGFYLGKSNFTGDLINTTTRLPEHDFSVTYPMDSTVLLANVVLNFDKAGFMFHPYIGGGFGGAVVQISGANSKQIAPLEVGINHYNANTSDTAPTFAGQFKAGLSYDFNSFVSIFAEYRYLYLARTHFTFGSTVYPIHVPTTSWEVTLNNQNYNLGVAGIRFNLS
ncbi:MAG TPA: hypothetical protein VHS53_15190 [Mucilaginibacter sp.]|nr:hypothetical protein [Mucilaginibacter sp.]